MDLKNKKIMVTGGDGFLGAYVVEELLCRGVAPTGITIPHFPVDDLRRWEDCQRLVRGMDVVIHLAARVGGAAAQQARPGEFFYDNLSMGSQLLEAARQAGVAKVVVVSSINAYPAGLQPPFSETQLWDGYPELANASYGVAKRVLATQVAAYRQQYNCAMIYLILPNLYGPSRGESTHHTSHLIPMLIKKIMTAQQEGRSEISLWGTGKAEREWLFAADAAMGIVQATEVYDDGAPLNIGSGQVLCVKHLVEKIAHLMDFTGRITFGSTEEEVVSRRFLNSARARQLLDFQPQTTLDDGLRATVAWYLNPKS